MNTCNLYPTVIISIKSERSPEALHESDCLSIDHGDGNIINRVSDEQHMGKVMFAQRTVHLFGT